MFSRWHRQRLISLTFRLSPSQSCSHSPRSRAPPLSLVCSYPPLPLPPDYIPLARSRLSLSLVRILHSRSHSPRALPLALLFVRFPSLTLVRISLARSPPLTLVRIPAFPSLARSRSPFLTFIRIPPPPLNLVHIPLARALPLSVSFVAIPLSLSLSFTFPSRAPVSHSRSFASPSPSHSRSHSPRALPLALSSVRFPSHSRSHSPRELASLILVRVHPPSDPRSISFAFPS